MRISEAQIIKLQKLLKDELGLELDSEQAQEAGLAIIRFIKAKSQRLRNYGNQDQ